MPFDGPGTYSIVSYQAPNLACNSWGGTMSPAEQVKLHDKSPMTPNQIWAFVKVAEKGDQSEYCILNCNNGYYLTGNTDKAVINNAQSTARNAKSRWTLQYVQSQGRYDTYFINCVDQSCGQLNIAGGGSTNSTNILSWNIENGENCKFYLDKQGM